MWSATRPLLILLCGASFLIVGTYAVKSRYVCQGERLRLRCESDYVLRIYSAKYGRVEPGTSICPHENITDLNCEAEGVLLKVISKCANRRRCIIKADNSIFGNPCPGTYKYLDVIYGCVPGDNWTPTPTSRQSAKTKPRTTTITTKSTMTKTTESTNTKSATRETPSTSQNSSKNTDGTAESNITIPTIKSTSRSWLSTSTTKQTKAPPKAPDSNASGRAGEVGAIIALLKSLYLTYRFISGTQLLDLSTSVAFM